MNDYIQANKRSLLLLTGLLFILIIVLYLILLRPLLADLSKKEKDIDSITANIELLETKIANFNEDIKEMDVEHLMLENKIPTERNLDEYILSLQKLEEMTESKIESINFVYDSSLEEIEKEHTEEQAPPEEDLVEENNEDELDGADMDSSEVEVTVDPVIIKEKPEQLQVMTVRLVAASPSYENFIELLKIIENQERISIISSLHFNQPTEDELYFSNNSSKTIPFEAELTTFYYPE